MKPFVEFVGANVLVGESRRIVCDLSLQVAEGETLALLGRSGSGKTTALRLLNALLLPSAGRVLVAGRETTAWNPIELRRRTGYVIQEIGLFPHLTVADNVGMVPSLEGWPADRIAARTSELLELVGLPAGEFAARRPHQLSGGQRQRVGVARALAADPPLLLLDEPFGALDPVTRRELQTEFRALTARLGKTAVFVTHDLAEAARVADRVALLADGRLVAAGTLEEFAASRHPEVRAFVGAGEDAAPLRAGAAAEGVEPSRERAAADGAGPALERAAIDALAPQTF
ncbi:MAG: ATP-binding cassette domain-containing protein [Candidatus Binatia bacterium]